MTLDEIVEEFMSRQRVGEAPSVKEYVERHPEIAPEILATLPALALVEELKPSTQAGLAAELADRRPPNRIGDYRIVEELGRGGMGIVYLAEQVSLQRFVALKLLPLGISRNARAVQRFQREARAAAKMHHTNIVPVFEVGEDAGRLFYAMQLIQGRSLDHIIDGLKSLRQAAQGPAQPPAVVESGAEDDTTDRRLAALLIRGQFTAESLVDSDTKPNIAESLTETQNSQRPGDVSPLGGTRSSSSTGRFDRQDLRSIARIGLQVADALAYAHSRGIIHRDIKPSNLILDSAGVVWVSDFGLAKADNEELTQTGDFVGTIRYMSPERFAGHCDELADIYALGLTLYELLALCPAFDFGDRLQLIEAIAKREPTPLSVLTPDLPIDLETIVLKCLEKEPQLRYRSADELSQDLHRFLMDEPIKARRSSPLERCRRWSRRNKGLAASLAAVASLLLLFGIAGPVAFFREAKLRKQAQQSQQLATDRGAEVYRNLYFAEMNLAGQSVREPGGIGTVAELTARWNPLLHRDQRHCGWEWFYLYSRCHRERLILPELDYWVWSVAWSPDGAQLASSGQSREILLWDARDGHLLRKLTAPWGVRRVQWSPTGNRLAVGGAHGAVRIFDAASGDVLHVLTGTADQVVYDIQWSPQGNLLAEAGEDGTVNVWSTESGHKAYPSLKHQQTARCLDFSPDGTRLVTASHDGTMTIWEAATGQLMREIPHAHAAAILTVDWSPDGKKLVTGSQDHRIRVWDADTTTLAYERQTPIGGVLNVSWHPDSRSFASAHWDRVIRIWDAETGYPSQSLEGHTGEIRSIAWSPQGNQLASGSLDGTIRMWDMGTIDQNRTLHDADRVWCTECDWNPVVTQLAWGNFAGHVKVWDAESDRVRIVGRHNPRDNTEAHAMAVRWDHGGRRLASGGNDGMIRIWQERQPDVATVLWEHGDDVQAVCWSPDDRYLASAGNGGVIRIWDVASRKEAAVLSGHSEAVLTLDWSPAASLLASGDILGAFKLWDTRSWEEIHPGTSQSPGNPSDAIMSVRFSPDGRRIAVGSIDRTLKIWDVGTRTAELAIDGNTGGVLSVDWSPDGTRLIASADNGMAKIWDAQTGIVALTLALHRDAARCVRWAADGKKIASTGIDDTVRIMDASIGYRLATPPGRRDGDKP